MGANPDINPSPIPLRKIGPTSSLPDCDSHMWPMARLGHRLAALRVHISKCLTHASKCLVLVKRINQANSLLHPCLGLFARRFTQALNLVPPSSSFDPRKSIFSAPSRPLLGPFSAPFELLPVLYFLYGTVTRRDSGIDFASVQQ
jgi:hypothetical protein